jgi:hypothetical protein
MIAGRTQASGHIIDAFDQMDRLSAILVRVACIFERHQTLCTSHSYRIATG